MAKLIINVMLINLVAAVVVFVLSQYVDAFTANHIEDYLFFVVIILWALAKLMWTGGMHSKITRIDDAMTDKTYSMVKGHDFDGEQQIHYRQNYQTGFVLFIAGIPALIACVVIYWL